MTPLLFRSTPTMPVTPRRWLSSASFCKSSSNCWNTDLPSSRHSASRPKPSSPGARFQMSRPLVLRRSIASGRVSGVRGRPCADQRAPGRPAGSSWMTRPARGCVGGVHLLIELRQPERVPSEELECARSVGLQPRGAPANVLCGQPRDEPGCEASLVHPAVAERTPPPLDAYRRSHHRPRLAALGAQPARAPTIGACRRWQAPDVKPCPAGRSAVVSLVCS